MLEIPDLLHLVPRLSVDTRLVSELLEMAFLGKDSGADLDQALSGSGGDGEWRPEFFADDLFLRELIHSCFSVQVGSKVYSINEASLARVLADPPPDAAGIAFRQEIVRELDENSEVLAAFEGLYESLYQLLASLRLPGKVAGLDVTVYRLDLLRQCKVVIDSMADGFEGAVSGVARLRESGLEIQQTSEYELLRSLLDYEQRLSTIKVEVNVGASGRITGLTVDEIAENTENLFYLGPWHRLRQRLTFLIRGYKWDSASVVSRLVHQVFLKLTPSITPLIQVIGDLEFYLANRGFRETVRRAGLEVSLPTFDDRRPIRIETLFNPLLLDQEDPPVPCDISTRRRHAVTLITGPNSGGKTRLLQAIGLAQLLGQSGLFVASTRANLPIVRGIFVSLIQRETADQSEGRLGRELLRIRTMFDAIEPPSMVILDELCSGTNPSEGTELFSLVLRLLERLGPRAFITTHFLDYARELEESPPVTGLEFIQVEIDSDQNSTYQFIPGVAATSLASVMAERLGVTFDELAVSIDQRLESERQPS
jgi:DNA mismatch repair protein MutS2